MKRVLLFSFLVLAGLTVVFAELTDNLPLSVQQFLLEESEARLVADDGNLHRNPASQFAPVRTFNGIKMVDAFIDFDDRGVIADLKANGVIVNCIFNDFITALVPIDKLASISHIPGVLDVEVSHVLEQCTDSTLRFTHAGQVLEGTDYGLQQAYDGSGVIVGIIDSGFDYKHLAFRRADNHDVTRIVRIYDTTDSTGHPVIIGEESLPGTVFMDEQIDTLKKDSGDTHGTHVACIAAGLNVNGYGGMAPGADIVLCSAPSMSSGIIESEVINCMKYICSYADSVGKPCVINISVSTRFGPHDGMDRMSKAIEQLTGPGRIIVLAAGNNGNSDLYVHQAVTEEKPLNMLIGHDSSHADESYYYGYARVDTWVREVNVRPVFSFHILDKLTNHIVWRSDTVWLSKYFYTSSFSDYYEPKPTVGTSGYMFGGVYQSPSNRKFYLTCEFKNLLCKSYVVDSVGDIESRYQIGVTIYPPSVHYPKMTDSCYVDSWTCNSDARRTYINSPIYIDQVTSEGDTITQTFENFYAQSSNDCSIGSYAVSDSVISAGGYIGRTKLCSMYGDWLVNPDSWLGARMSSSSYQKEGIGPTGKPLPTITAPSYNVISGVSRYSYFVYKENYYLTIMRTDDGSYWGAMTGTSMAAPTVAGIIAQWLQINPSLSPSDIKNILAQTAIKDDKTEDPTVGYRFGPNGKIDAMAGVRLLLGLGDILPGDINSDGEISIKDLTLLIDLLLENEISGINKLAADVNQDGYITIKDVTVLIDILLEM